MSFCATREKGVEIYTQTFTNVKRVFEKRRDNLGNTECILPQNYNYIDSSLFVYMLYKLLGTHRYPISLQSEGKYEHTIRGPKAITVNNLIVISHN